MASPSGAADEPPSAKPSLSRVRAVVNVASGSVGAGAAEKLKTILSLHGIEAEISEVQPDGVSAAVHQAVAARPDLVIVLAGDGTACLAAELAGAEGPLIAPLPGGTMNMLPHALYGQVAWPEALEAALSRGEARTISGGEVGGRPFHCAAIIGEPALWAPAREALRHRKFRKAWIKARVALRRAFAGRLRFSLEDGPRRKAEALTLLCPLISKGLHGEVALEAAALETHNAFEAFRLGVNWITGDWRRDPAVTSEACRRGKVWARGRISAVLDGEPVHLDGDAEIRFKPNAFRALVPPDPEAAGVTGPEPSPA